MMVFGLTTFKLARILKQYGKEYELTRKSKNDFGEPTVPTTSLKLVGIFHPAGERRISLSGADASTKQTEAIPCILASWQEASNVAVGDLVDISGVAYSVSGINNVGALNVAGEISLEAK